MPLHASPRLQFGRLSLAAGAALLVAAGPVAQAQQPGAVVTGEPGADNRLYLAPQAAVARADLAPRIERLLEGQAMPSLTVALFDADEVLWAEAFGHANLATRTRATLDTVYNTGSTFKFVLATAIMQLAERGEVSLDAPVNSYLTHKIDDFAEEGRPLTLRAMLAHRAGLPASRPVPDTDVWSRTLPPSDDELLTGLAAIERPGEVYDYCNICFPIYGEVIRNVTGRSVEDYLRDNILIPAQVRHTEPFYPDARAAERMALPYARVGPVPWPVGQKFLQAPYSGDAYMRPLDMVRLLQPFLNEGRVGDGHILDPATVRSMIEPQYDGGRMSLAFLSQAEGGVRVLSWDGGIYGGSTVYQIEPETGLGVYIASNSNQTTDVLHAIARRARELYRGVADPVVPDFDPVEEPGPAMLADAALGSLAGRYAITGTDAALVIHRLGDQLAVINPTGKRLELVMTGPHRGILVATREQVFFTPDADGTASALRLEGDGYAFDAERAETD